MNQINLLVITREYPTATAGTKRIQHILECLLVKEVSIMVLSLRSRNAVESEIGTLNKINYRRIGSGIDLKIMQIHKIFKFYISTISAIIRTKKFKQKNILYSYGGLNIENLLFILLAKFAGYKIIFDIVEDYALFDSNVKISSKFKNWTTTKLDNLGVYLSHGIIVISSYLENKYKKFKNTNIVLLSITALQNNPISIKTTFNRPLRIVYAGSFGKKDGIDFIVEGFLEFNKIEKEAKLILIGSSEEQKKCKEKYHDLENLLFTGFIPDEEYYKLIRDADILCMCRTKSAFANAGFPFKLGEYLATGNPVIASKVSDIEKYLTPNDAYLIEPENKEHFFDALFAIKNNPSDAFLKGQNGLNVCKEHFSPQKNGLALYDFLCRL